MGTDLFQAILLLNDPALSVSLDNAIIQKLQAPFSHLEVTDAATLTECELR